MTFFYDLNKKLDSIREMPETTHKQLNERDEGKPGKNFAKIAKDAGERYGSKAAGERVAGAVRNKLKAQGKLEEEGMSRAAKGYEKYGKEGMEALAKAGREGKALDPVRAKYNKYDKLDEVGDTLAGQKKLAQVKSRAEKRAFDDRSATDSKYAFKQHAANVRSSGRMNQPTEEGLGDMAKKVGSMAKKVGGKVLDKLGHGDDAEMLRDLQRKMGVPPEQRHGKPGMAKSNEDYGPMEGASSIDFDKVLDAIAALYGDDIWENDAMQDLANDLEQAGPTDKELDFIIAKGKLPKRLAGIQFSAGDDVQFGESSAPMTPKQKSFAKLAPPKDKITFADKIAGAKKEVDERLGDVAAEAIKGALSPKQKKIDMNKNGKLDANDFAMLRKGGKQETDEGWDDMMKDVERRRSQPKVGSVTHGAKHDIETTATGRRVTRRTDDQGYSVGADDDTPADAEKRGRGRPKGTGSKMGAKGPSGRSKLMTKENNFDPAEKGEYDREGDMAKDSIKTVVRHAQALEKILGDDDNLPEWVQSKLAKIESMMTAVDDYMQNQKGDEEMAMGEEKTTKRDNRAEKAGKQVTKDIEYDEKKKDDIHGKKRGSEDAKAEKAGKKVAKDIEYDEKKDKPKKVKEQGGAETPTASSGFSFGKGIYDSMNRELENMIAESMTVNMSDSTEGGKSLTITATDEDAMKLAMMLKSAGLGGSGSMGQEQGEESCSSCGMSGCGCGDVQEAIDENSPDWPTDTETSDNALQYSGGMNGPKSTGQTTIPVIASQEDRQHTYEDDQELRRMMEMSGIQQDNLKPWERTMKEEVEEETEEEAEEKELEESFEQTLNRMRDIAGIKEAKKPDFPDIDNDGDNKESIAKAAKDAEKGKKVKESISS
jgi:hypothetical protein